MQLRFITNWGSFFLLPIGAAFLLQIGASVVIKWSSLIITNQRKFYYKSGQLLQIRATVITNWGITFDPKKEDLLSAKKFNFRLAYLNRS